MSSLVFRRSVASDVSAIQNLILNENLKTSDILNQLHHRFGTFQLETFMYVHFQFNFHSLICKRDSAIFSITVVKETDHNSIVGIVVLDSKFPKHVQKENGFPLKDWESFISQNYNLKSLSPLTVSLFFLPFLYDRFLEQKIVVSFVVLLFFINRDSRSIDYYFEYSQNVILQFANISACFVPST